MTKGKMFYTELEKIIKETVDNNVKNMDLRELRYEVDKKTKEFYNNQTIFKKLTRQYMGRDVVAYFIGVYMYPYINKVGDRTKDIEKLTRLVYSMYVYGEDPMVAPDVAICGHCHKQWLSDSRI